MKLLELEPVPKNEEENSGHPEQRVGAPEDSEDRMGSPRQSEDWLAMTKDGDEEENSGHPEQRAEAPEDSGDRMAKEPPVGASSARPPRGWRRMIERLGEFVGVHELDGEEWDPSEEAAQDRPYGEENSRYPERAGESAGERSSPLQDGPVEEEETDGADFGGDGAGESAGGQCPPLQDGSSGGDTELPTQEPGPMPGGASGMPRPTDGDRGVVTEPPTQEPGMTDYLRNESGPGPMPGGASGMPRPTDGDRGVVTEPPTQEPGMTDGVRNALPPAARRAHARIRAEWVMVGIAFLAAGVLGVTAALCKPYFGADEDPMELPSYHLTATEPEETILEPDETEPKNPTIPPDRNPYDRYDFQYNSHNYLLLQNVESYPGVDVSAFQGKINWKQVAASGIRFAIVRLGYRGYGSGKLVEDEYAQANLEGAADAGLQVGAYFFSQALNEKEVDEEIEFLLDVLGEQYLDMPVILDWEIPAADARTAGKMDARSLTDLQLYFCREMEMRGYQPMVYFNWHQSEELYLLSELEEYPFWLALYQDRMTYPWKVEMWQYSCTGRVPGIQGDVDLNVYMP